MTANSNIVAGHYNSLPETGLKIRDQSKILYLRNFNNWIKSNLIREYARKSYRVLDMGSGKGGDQLKWAKACVSHVSFLDIAELSVEQSHERHQKGRFRYSADFRAADFTEIDFKSIYSLDFDLISCQFAFHYCFESLEKAHKTLGNIASRLRAGGHFIGTTINAFELMRRWRDCAGCSFGNDVYRVTFPSDESSQTSDLFGMKYDFYLEGAVDCPEFAVYPPLMDKLAEHHRLELVQRLSFPEYYRLHCDTREGRQLIDRIHALEQLSIDELPHLPSDEYAHAIGHRDPHEFQSVLTMSRSEWEVVQLYDVFVYRKI